MKRRALLVTVGAVGTGVLAGCTGNAPGERPADSPTTTDSPTRSPTSTPCPVDLTSTAFEVRSVECGTGQNTADASVDPAGASTADGPQTYTVTVTGTIEGRDTCYSARLGAVDSVPGEDTLRVAVESYVPESDTPQACGQCLVDIDYDARVELACGYYGRVTVVHDGETVAEIPLPE